VHGDPLSLKRCGFGGNGLRTRGFFPGHRRRWHRPFLDGPERRAGEAVEHIAEPLLGDLGHGFDAASLDREVDQIRRGGQVIIPQAMMHQLEVPDSSAGLRFECDETFGKEVIARALPPIIIIGRRREGQVDVAQRLIAAHHRPDIRIAGVFPGLVLPGVDA
jgi:hypothetical protein